MIPRDHVDPYHVPEMDCRPAVEEPDNCEDLTFSAADDAKLAHAATLGPRLLARGKAGDQDALDQLRRTLRVTRWETVKEYREE